MMRKRTLLAGAAVLAVALAAPAAEPVPEVVVQQGHRGFVNAVRFSADGRWLVTASYDSTVKLWEVASGRMIRNFPQESEAHCAQLSPDGRVLVTGQNNGHLTAYETATGAQLWRVEKHNSPDERWANVFDVAFSPDGTRLVTGSDDGTYRVWDAKTGQEIRAFRAGADKVHSVAFAPDGTTFVAAAAKPPVVFLHSASSLEEVRRIELPDGYISQVGYSPDGREIFTNVYGYGVVFWDAGTGAEQRSTRSNTLSCALSHDGRYLAAGDATDIKIYDLRSGETLHTLSGHTEPIETMAFSPTSYLLASGSSDETARLWDARAGVAVRQLTGTARVPARVRFLRDGRRIAMWNARTNYITDGQDSLALWDRRSGKLARIFEGHEDYVLSGDGKRIAALVDTSGGKREAWEIRLWDSRSGRRLRFKDRRRKRVVPVALSDDGTKLLVHAKRNDVLSVPSGRVVGSIHEQHNLLAFAPNGRWVAGEDYEHDPSVWDARRDAWLFGHDGDKSTISDIVFSRDGTLLLSGSFYGSVKLYDVKQKKIRYAPKLEDSVQAVALSPRGEYFAAGGSTRTVHVWSTRTGEAVHAFEQHTGSVLSLDFSPDGTFLLSASMDGSARIWELATGREIVRLFRFGESDWVTMTPDGRFDGSTEGMRSLHLVQGTDVIPLDSLFERLYTPKLLAQALTGKLAEPEAGALDITRRPLALPPRVRITTPASGQIFSSAPVEVQVEALDQHGGGIAEIQLFHNGKRVADDQRGLKLGRRAKGARTTRTFQLLLVPGRNSLVGRAISGERIDATSAEVVVQRAGARASATLHLVTIGLNASKNPRYRLNYGRGDAKAFRQAVERGGRSIFSRIEAHSLFDQEAVKPKIKEVFERVAAQARQEDVFVFFYAGHGVMGEARGDTPAEFYLIPWDVTQLYGNEEMLQERGVSGAELREWCAAIPAQKQLVVLDACESGGAVTTFALRGAAQDKAIHQLARSAGVVVLSATGSEQFATEFKKLRHGVFTYALLEGLKGAADGAGDDGKITVKELSAFLEDRVPELTAKYRGTAQYPNSFTRGQDFPLCVK